MGFLLLRMEMFKKPLVRQTVMGWWIKAFLEMLLISVVWRLRYCHDRSLVLFRQMHTISYAAFRMVMGLKSEMVVVSSVGAKSRCKVINN